jgi:carbonic anhydrase
MVVAVYELQADEIIVIGHKDCGMSKMNPESIMKKFEGEGISKDAINTLIHSGIDLNKWLEGFDDVFESVKNSVNVIKNHPLIPKRIPVHGLVIDPTTGELEIAESGY